MTVQCGYLPKSNEDNVSKHHDGDVDGDDDGGDDDDDGGDDDNDGGSHHQQIGKSAARLIVEAIKIESFIKNCTFLYRMVIGIYVSKCLELISRDLNHNRKALLAESQPASFITAPNYSSKRKTVSREGQNLMFQISENEK